MTIEPAVIEGGCLCGRVRYRITGPVIQAGYCHCEMCRRSSGAPVVAWIHISRSEFAFTKGSLSTYESSDGVKRRFCPDCGGHLTFESEQLPDRIAVTMGTLDDPGVHPPKRHGWTSSRISWLHLDEHLPSFEEDAPMDWESRS